MAGMRERARALTLTHTLALTCRCQRDNERKEKKRKKKKKSNVDKLEIPQQNKIMRFKNGPRETKKIETSRIDKENYFPIVYFSLCTMPSYVVEFPNYGIKQNKLIVLLPMAYILICNIMHQLVH